MLSKSTKTPVVQSILAEHAPAYGLTLCSCSHSWKNGTIKVILIYELWKEIQQSRIPLISEHFPIKAKLWLFLSGRWWNPLAFLKNCIRIVTGFHQFYCLCFSLTCRTLFHNGFNYWAFFLLIWDLSFQTVLEVLKADACRPECTWEFCKANPNEICSAR